MNIKQTQILIIGLVLLFSGRLLGQQTIFPSPDASALVKSIDVPVDLSTGIPNVQVPLFNLPAKGGISVPVLLNYHASGVKVREISSVVGAGWNLLAGGKITRVVKGNPDLPAGNNRCEEIEMIDNSNAGCDEAADIFYFSFLGRSGRFYLDENAKPYTQPYQNINIKFSQVGFVSDVDNSFGFTFHNWVITDENGYKYVFGNSDISKEETWLYSETYTGSQYYDPSPMKSNFQSTWHLTKVLNPAGEEVVNIDYISGSDIESYDLLQSAEKVLYDYNGNTGTTYTSVKYTNKANPKYISNIETASGSIVFTYDNNRDDLVGGKKLSSIKLRDYQFQEIESYELIHDYFKGLNSRRETRLDNFSYQVSPFWDQTFLDTFSETVDDTNIHRLKLEKIHKKNGSVTTDYRRFVYNMQKGLPDYNSIYIDHYGFYNGTTIDMTYTPRGDGYPEDQKLLPDGLSIPKSSEVPLCNQYTFDISSNLLMSSSINKVQATVTSCSDHYGASFDSPGRNSNFEDAKANILEEIHYPTGSYKKLIYESSGNNAGIIRVHKISDFDDNDVEIDSKEYQYENEQVFGVPVYHYLHELVKDYDNSVKTTIKAVVSSNSYTNLFNANGSPVCYGKVTVINKDQSYVEKTFIVPVEASSLSRNYSIHFTNIINTGSYVSTPPETAPFVSKNANFWKKGLISKEAYYESLSNQKEILEIDYTYNTSLPYVNQTKNYKVIEVGKIDILTSSTDARTKTVGYNYNISQPIFLDSKITKTYDQTNNTYLTTREDYTYDTQNLQLIKTESYNTNGITPKYISENKYITHSDYDYSNVAAQNCQDTFADCEAQCEIDGYNDGINVPNCVNGCTIQYNSCMSAVSNTMTEETEAILAMRNKHMISSPIEIRNYIETNGAKTLVSTEMVEFNLQGTNNQMALPSAIWMIDKAMPANNYAETHVNNLGEFTRDSDLKKQVTFSSYDQSNGNLLSQTDVLGITTSYEWGYNDGNSNNDHLLTATIVNPGSDQRRSEKTYKPLVGVLTETDPYGNTISYEYDNQNRLKLIRDKDGNIVERYRYYFKETDNITLDAGFTISGKNKINTNMTFKATGNPNAFGVTKYQWDFGDGTPVVETESLTTYHAFSTSDIYSVQLTVVNPDYASVSTTQNQVIASNDASISICASGLRTYDLCGVNATVIVNSCNIGSPSNVNSYFSASLSTGAVDGTLNQPYAWYYVKGNNSAVQFTTGNSATKAFAILGEGSYQIYCSTTDTGGNTYTSNIKYVSITKSDPNCNGQLPNEN